MATVLDGIVYASAIGDRVQFEALTEAPAAPGMLVYQGLRTGTVTALCPDEGLPAIVEVCCEGGGDEWLVPERDLEWLD